MPIRPELRSLIRRTGVRSARVRFERAGGRCQRYGRPHLAQIESRRTPGLDARTTRHASYRISQRKRKRVEEIFGWMKSWGGLRRTRFRGVARVQLHAYIVGAAYNLLRLSRLQPATG